MNEKEGNEFIYIYICRKLKFLILSRLYLKITRKLTYLEILKDKVVVVVFLSNFVSVCTILRRMLISRVTSEIS